MHADLSKSHAKALWIHAQGLDREAPFGKGPQAIPTTIEHLGYVQIDTISVIERCHHHILFNRAPDYQKRYLQTAQAQDKSVFECWTHALSYVSTKDFRYYMPDMQRRRDDPNRWSATVDKSELQRVVRLIKKNGPLSIRDIKDDVLVEKTHAWASRKPSKRALQLGFYSGRLTISERQGMVKKYELSDRHFAWQEKPKAAKEQEVQKYLLARALRAQAVISLDSVCHLDAQRKKPMLELIESEVKRGNLTPVKLQGVEKIAFWSRPESLEQKVVLDPERLHILSPFDPLIIQRKRLAAFFDYEHLFEAYVPKAKRVFGYFSLPVLAGDQIIALLDLKTDRQQKRLLIQKWNWLGKHKSKSNKQRIETALEAFAKFQLAP